MILALRALGLGDLLTAVPALRALRRAAGRHDLVLVTSEPLVALVQRYRLADRWLLVPAAVASPPKPIPWRGAPPEFAVNLHDGGPQSTDVLRRLRPDLLWSYGITGAPAWRDDEHEVTRWCRLVEFYGCPTRAEDLYLGGPAGRGGPILIHPGAARPHRRWPARRFGAVAAGLARLGFRVRVTAGPGERDLASTVTRMGRLPRESVIAGIGLVQLADLVSVSRLVICADTGVAHLATAMRTPSVVLFGPQSPARWGPPPNPIHRVLWKPRAGEHSAPTHRPHPSLRRIGAAEVLAAAIELLNAAQPPRTGEPM